MRSETPMQEEGGRLNEYQPLWHTLKERSMRKEDLRLATSLTTNMIASMGEGEHISMKTLLRICGTSECDISDVIELEREEDSGGDAKR